MMIYGAGFSGKYDIEPLEWSGGWFGKQLYEFQNYMPDPLTCVLPCMRIVRPDRHFTTDLGSVPKTLQALAPIYFAKDRFPKSYIFHDSHYKHGGGWFAIKGGWEFRRLTRKQADDILREMVLLEGGSRIAARLIWAGVRAGGWASWKG